jgi:dephospho-CoA kinase
MIIIGLTGSICCGKSTVSRTFINNNIPVIDADIVARQVVVPGSVGLKQIVNTFGFNYLNEDGTLNRTKLGALVFHSKQDMNQLNYIMQELIHKEAKSQFNKLNIEGHKIAVWDAALIIEQKNTDKYRPLIVVSCPRDMQVERLMKRNNLTRDDAMVRINAQMSTEEKIKFADYVIDTSSDISSSIKQTEDIIRSLRYIYNV